MGKTQKKQGIPYPEWRWVRNRRPAWYALPENESPEARIFLTNALSDRHLHKYSDNPVIADKRLHVVLPKKKVNWRLLIAVLNSSFVAVSAELAGRIIKGDGVLEVDYDDLHDHVRIPDVREFSSEDAERILDAFSKLADRPIESIEREITKSDRIALDQAVLHAIGLSHRKFLSLLYEGLCELVSERITLGKMRGKARKTKARGAKAEKKAAEEVLDEVLPDGPKRFPEEFLSGAATAATKTLVDLPDAPLIFDSSPLFAGVHTADNSFSRPVKTPAGGQISRIHTRLWPSDSRTARESR